MNPLVTLLLYVLFWLTLFLVLYNYLFYPLVALVRSRLRTIPHECFTSTDEWPSVTLIIPALGDVNSVRAKLENTVALDYPQKKLLLLAVSDKNDAAVQTLLAEYKKRHILNFSAPNIESTYHALDLGAKLVKTSIMIFTGPDNELNDTALKQLVRHFKDPSIGAVSGIRSLYTSKSKRAGAGDNLYWKYETFIKTAESRMGSVTAAAGELLAIRKNLYQPVPKHVINFDSAITFSLVKQRYRVIIDDEALSLMQASRDLKNSFRERTLMTKGGFQTFFREFKTLIPPKTWFAFSYLSHKWLRLVIPFLLPVLFVIPFFLLSDPVMQIMLALQVFFYLFAIAGWNMRDKPDLPTYLNLAGWFAAMNLAVFVGFFRFLFRR